MSVDAGVAIPVVGNELLQPYRGLGQALNGECHVLNEARRANGTCAAHRGEDARADSPVLAIDGRVFGELCRLVETELAEALLDLGNFLQQLFVGDALGFGEDGRQVVVVARLYAGYLACIHVLLVLQEDGVVNRVKRHVVEHLRTLHHEVLGTHLQVFVASLQLLHGHHGLAALLHGEEIDHGRCLVLVVGECLHGDF